MDLSGIIFVVLALAWAVYLIPKALQHHDEIARTRSIDRFSTAMRVLARREPVNRRDSRLVVTPARPLTPRILGPTQTVAAVAAVVASSEAPAENVRPAPARPAPQRAAARAAARRRRRILIFLLLANLAVGGVAGFAYLPWWSLSIPGGLAVAYLFLCRRQVRRENRSSGSVPVAAVELGQGFGEVSTDEDTISLSSAALGRALEAATVEQADAAAVGVVSSQGTSDGVSQGLSRGSSQGSSQGASQGDSLWDPLPMTLPTYVSKPRAPRTVRTIDLTHPNTWSSGRSEADSKLVEETAAAQEEAVKATGEQRAVGS